MRSVAVTISPTYLQHRTQNNFIEKFFSVRFDPVHFRWTAGHSFPAVRVFLWWSWWLLQTCADQTITFKVAYCILEKRLWNIILRVLQGPWKRPHKQGILELKFRWLYGKPAGCSLCNMLETGYLGLKNSLVGRLSNGHSNWSVIIVINGWIQISWGCFWNHQWGSGNTSEEPRFRRMSGRD